MRKLLLLLLFLCPALAYGQNYTVVTATVRDPNGAAYKLGSYSISFVNTSTQQEQFGGSSNFQKVYSGGLDGNGALSITLPSNAVIIPAGTQWKFTVCSNPKQIAYIFPLPTTPCFVSTQTVSGASIDFTTAFRSAAAAIPTTSGGDTAHTSLNYSNSQSAFFLVQNDGAFDPVLYIVNSATPGYLAGTGDYHEVSVNVDGQVDYTTHHWNGSAFQISSLLDLDQDSHFGLASFSGGGIADDPITGDTCIPASVTPISCKALAEHISSAGIMNQYLGVATVGIGHAGVEVFRSIASRSTNLSFTIPPLAGGANTTAAACPSSGANCPGSLGLYDVVTLFTVSVAGTASTLLAQISYTDDVQAQTNKPCLLIGPGGVTTTAQSMVNVGDTMTADCKIWAAANTNITLVWTFAGTANPTVSAKAFMFSYGQ
jgi:hypothetical protein